jgi:hypothetical protein
MIVFPPLVTDSLGVPIDPVGDVTEVWLSEPAVLDVANDCVLV